MIFSEEEFNLFDRISTYAKWYDDVDAFIIYQITNCSGEREDVAMRNGDIFNYEINDASLKDCTIISWKDYFNELFDYGNVDKDYIKRYDITPDELKIIDKFAKKYDIKIKKGE